MCRCVPLCLSYPPELARMLKVAEGPHTGQALHAVYKAGHFIISFSGCNVLVGNRTACNQAFEAYADAAK